jgi:hypothetical protein
MKRLQDMGKIDGGSSPCVYVGKNLLAHGDLIVYFVLCNVSDNEEIEKYQPTQLGSAVLASSMSPDEGLAVFAELQKARQCFVLVNELHIIYLVRFVCVLYFAR